jgi:tRNA wybutosine-synthesizing protein 3
MSFETKKNLALSKKDKSSIGSIDIHIKPLCDTINSKTNLYTTSSCAGRILLIKLPDSGRKNDSEWVFVSHEEASAEKVRASLSQIPPEEVWFRYEPFILHVAARTLDDANNLLNLMHNLGIKRAGIIALGEKIVLEIIGNERIDTLVSKEGKLLVSFDYMDILVRKANSKLRKNIDDIGRIAEAMENL